MNRVFVTAAELHGRFSGRPTSSFVEMVVRAASRALRAASLAVEAIDAVYTGAMGNFDPEGFVGPVPIRLANRLGLTTAEITPMLVGSSEAGAWVLRHAYEAMRHGSDYRNVLVVAGEQMNPTASATPLTAQAKLEAQIARNRAICEILDERELHYGLNMLRMGDLTMDAIRLGEGYEADDVTDLLLPNLARAKYARVAGYPMGHLYGKRLTLEEHAATPRITRYFNMHDVSPTSSGAVALILSRDPRPDSVEIMGVGQAFVPLSLAARDGNPRRSRNTRLAITRAYEEAGVGPDWLRSCDFSLLHDAFPSIEATFLRELDMAPDELLERALSGWCNPFGGLKTCGHALGASGLLQIAKAFHRMTGDPRYVSEAARRRMPEANTAFATSVGGPLTNVVVTLMRRASHTARPTRRGRQRYERITSEIDQRYTGVRAQIPPGRALALASTRIHFSESFGDDDNPLLSTLRTPWIHLVERAISESSERPKSYAFSEEPIEPGALVSLKPETIGGVVYSRAVAGSHRIDLGARMTPDEREKLIRSLRLRETA